MPTSQALARLSSSPTCSTSTPAPLHTPIVRDSVLVAEGKVVAAQHRLGHRDLSTTLRHYGWAQAPDDMAITDHLDAVLNRCLGDTVTERR